MEIDKFEKEFKEYKNDQEYSLQVISADDIEDCKEIKVVVDGEEIQDKVMYLICIKTVQTDTNK